MKSIFLALIVVMCIVEANAQDQTNVERITNKRNTAIADSTVVEINRNGKKENTKIIFEYGKESIDKHLKDSAKNRGITSISFQKENPFFAGITFSRFDLGLARMLDNGKSSLSPTNEFLKYRNWKSVNVGFDVLQMGYKFNDQFKMHIAAGLDWTHFRLRENILFLEDTEPLTYVASDINYKKNRFSTSYLRIPLTFEVRTKAGAFNNRFRLAAGPIAGILLQGSQKLKSTEEGKRKVKDDFNFAPFRYGAFARIGYGVWGLYTKYYVNDMFVDSPDQEGLKNLSVGAMLIF